MGIIAAIAIIILVPAILVGALEAICKALDAIISNIWCAAIAGLVIGSIITVWLLPSTPWGARVYMTLAIITVTGLVLVIFEDK